MSLFPVRSVLAATDLREGSDAVIRTAAALAARAGAALYVLHALDLDSPPYGRDEDGGECGRHARLWSLDPG